MADFEHPHKRHKGWHLGINLGHDRAAALVKDGEILVAIHQERLDRIKHSVGLLHQSPADTHRIQLPWEAIHYCLDAQGLDLEDLNSITANMPGHDHGADILRCALPAKLKARIRVLPSHHLGHAYSAWWPSGCKQALVLVVDASGSANAQGTESYSLFRGDENGLQLLHGERVASHLAELSTLGFLYEYVTRKAGFVTKIAANLHIPEAGKLMGLAPYGGPHAEWPDWLELRPGDYSLGFPAYDIFLQIAAMEKRYDDGRGKPYLRPWLVDLAWKVQRELERALLHLVDLGMRQTGLRHLCLAGGVALNSVANYRLQQELGLQQVFAFPAAGDAGIAAGAALWACAQAEPAAPRRPLRRANLGRPYAPAEIATALEKFEERIQVQRLSAQASVERCAQALARGHIVARFQGGSEYGPRALGHRSILADPGFAQMRDIINARVKFRERFRPFAPVIPAEQVSLVFEQETPSPYMLLVAKVRPEYQQRIPAVTHHDGSGRIQTVTAADNPWMHALCERLPQLREGPPVVLNTSFNVAGQPIVETPQEAIATFLSADIDYLALEDCWISRKSVPVQDYQQHLSRLEDSPMPHGLEPGQPALTGLMQKLDRALFFGETQDCPWSEAELRQLSAFGGKFKETARRFNAHPFAGEPRSRLSPRVLLLLDPLGQSQLIDLEAKLPPLACDFNQLSLVMALLSDDGAPSLERLRRQQGLDTACWQRQIEDMLQQLRALGLQPRYQPRPVPSDQALPTRPQATLQAFDNPDYALWGLLARLRQRLQEAGYSESSICQALGIESLQQIEPTRLHYYARYHLGDSDRDDMIRLFLLRASLPLERLQTLFDAPLVEAMQQLGLLIARADEWAARIDLYLVDGLYIATDHRYMLLREDRLQEDPVMYIGLDSLGLALTAPRIAVDQLLDLCTGSGVQALCASRYAGQVTGVDLNPRALRFARFNAQLNGIHNARFIQADLYAGVAGQRFDSILANPPFVPSPEAELGFRDGGKRGEAILARIISAASEHLQAHGRLYIVTDLVDVGSYRQRLRNWWRGGASEQLVLHTADRDEALFSVPHSYAPFGQSFEEFNQELSRWIENFRAAELQSVNFGYILIHRLNQQEPSHYQSRVIHSPRRPMHEQVRNYFDQLRLMRSAQAGELFVQVNPGILLHSETRLNGSKAIYQLHGGDDPWYTRYTLDEASVELLRNIASSSPRLHSVFNTNQRERVTKLLHKGILQLSPGRANGRAARKRHRPAEEQRPMQADLIELESKTTPTCLTSYMKR